MENLGLDDYRAADTRESAHLITMRSFVSRHRDPFDRRIEEGHLTGSALVFHPSGERILLLHHRKLDRWLQPGGHAEPGERSGPRIALREAYEETGIAGLRLHPTAPRPFDLDVHEIPARGRDPRHRHLDLRYLVLAPEDAEPTPAEAEAHDVRWFSWHELSELGLDAGLERALGKGRSWLCGERTAHRLGLG